MNSDSAVDTARKYLGLRGIETTETKSVKLVKGSLRATYLPDRERDFWIVTLLRRANIIVETGDLNEEELEMLSAVADESSTISVAVEEDGSAEVI